MRKPMVTRTFKTTKVIVLCMDIPNREPCNIEAVLPRTYEDDKALLKAVKKAIETDTIKAVQVVDTQISETLYGMSEETFIEHATILPPRKDYSNNAEANEENND